MAVNQVIVGDEVKLDLTGDTVSENNLLAGVTAHNAAGEPITGAVVVAPIDSELSETSENPVQNKVITKALNEMGGGGSSTDIGDIKITACSNAPAGWLTCDGSAISRTDYSNLFSAIGTTYGSGDGSTTFNIPNLKGRVVVGIDGSDTDFSAIGKTGGEKAHRLTVNEMPSHTHGASYYTIAQPGGSSVGKLSGGSSYSLIRGDTTTSNTGNGTAHNNLQPYMALNYIIYTGVM